MKEPCIVIYTQFYHILVLEPIVLPWGRVFSANEISETLQFLIQRNGKKEYIFRLIALGYISFSSPFSPSYHGVK